MKIDEEFTAGPMTFTRAGRYMQIQSRWPAGEHEKFKERAKAERPKLKAGIESAVARLAEKLQKYDPIPLIGATFMDNVVVNPETYSEPNHKGSEAYVEYLQSLALSVPQMGSAPANKQVFDEITVDVKKIFEDVNWYFHFEFTEGKRQDWEYQVRYMSILAFLQLRGASIEEHHRELIRELFSVHDEFLLRHVGLTTAQIIDAAAEIEHQVVTAMNAQLLSMVRARQLHRRFQQFVDSRPELDSVPLDEVLRQFNSEVDPADRDVIKQMFAIDPNLIRPSDVAPAFLLDRLSAASGENHSFLASEKSKGWPTADSVIYTKPLIKRNNEFYCPNPILLFRKLDRIIESWIAEDGSYYRDTFCKKRGKFVERKALEYFSKLLPQSKAYANVYYTSTESGDAKRVETDALVTWDRALFIIESKAAGLDVPAQRGALDGLRDDLAHIIRDAFEQGLRTRRYIESSSPAVFETEHGDPVVAISKGDYDDIFIVNVTLESLGFLSSGIHLLKEMGLLTGDPWPWSVFLNDLRVIAELFETGSDFVAFLRSRLRAPELPQFHVADELDFLMAYLYEGVNLTQLSLKDVGLFNLHGYTVDLDRYYAFLAGDASTGSKPQTKTPALLQRLIEQIEKRGHHGFLRATLPILHFDRPTMASVAKQIERDLADVPVSKNRHQLILTSPDRKTVIAIYVGLSWSKSETAEKLAEVQLRKYDAKCDRWVSVFVYPGAEGLELYEYDVMDQVWRPDDKLDAEISQRKRAALRDYLRHHATPSRNDRCPCESGRKFKQCCSHLS